MSRRVLGTLAAVLCAGLVAGCGSSPIRPPAAAASPSPGSVVVRAAGGTVAAPIYQELGNLVRSDRITLNYQLAAAPRLVPGSTATSVPVVAAASATNLADARAPDGRTYIPVGFAATAVIANVPGVPTVRLTASTLARILQGAIGRWNAKPIARSNPGAALPSTPITLVHLGPASVLTDQLAQYLSDGSRRWRRAIGSGTAVDWPVGTAVADETSMISVVGQTPGAIGYVSQATALQQGVQAVRLQNAARAFVAPTLPATSAVGDQRLRDGSLNVTTIDAPARQAYPVAAELYALTYSNPCDNGLSPAQGNAVRQVLGYLTGPAGQALVARLSFAPLPARLAAAARTAVADLRCGTQSF